MIASLSENSIKQYNVYLKKWFTHCHQNNVDLYDASITDIINFLTGMYNDGAQYGTLNTCRSALALIIGDHVGLDQNIKRFFKGIFRSRPPVPKYDTTWDPAIVLTYLEKSFPHDTLSLELLSKKLVTLLALVTAHRVQTLSKINIDNITISNSNISIKITELIKTSRVGCPQPVLVLPFFDQKPEICPGKTLQYYLSKTEPLRGNVKYLFIGLKKPHRAVSSQTLSRWIRSTLCDSGVPAAAFSAHSTRHAATSLANRLGVSLDVIRRTAGWSASSDTFFKFYNRPLNIVDSSNESFARAIFENNVREK